MLREKALLLRDQGRKVVERERADLIDLRAKP
jgi:hypothetical protein